MHHFRNKEFIIDLVIGAILLSISLIIENYAVGYTVTHASNSVTDVILSNTRVYNVYGAYVYGAVILVAIIVMICAIKPQRAPFVLKTVALFTLVRAFCISLTHIGPFPAQIEVTSGFFTTIFPSFFIGDDFFFSGHTGLPFLMALIFWERPLLRVIFISFTALLATAVLLGHLHYSIDVVSAFFISFGVFSMAKIFFRDDWMRLRYNDREKDHGVT